jgi:hypothetical protein
MREACNMMEGEQGVSGDAGPQSLMIRPTCTTPPVDMYLSFEDGL